MTSRLYGLGLAATLAAATLTGCTSSRSFEKSKQNAETRLQNYFAKGETISPRNESPKPKPLVQWEYSRENSHIEEVLKLATCTEEDYFANELNRPKDNHNIDDLYDVCTGECLVDNPSASRIASWSINKIIDQFVDKGHPIHRSRDQARRVSGDVQSWFEEKTGGGRINTYGIGLMLEWRY